MEQEYPQRKESINKKIRNYTDDGTEKQKHHLNNIRQKAMEKREN